MSIPSNSDLVSDLQSVLYSDKISDVKLKGSDGIETPATRFILSCRSKVFSKMFFDEFLEARSQVVELKICSDTIRSIVAYCYTDVIKIADVDILRDSKADDFKALGEKLNDEFIVKIIKLAESANYFELNGLKEALKKWTHKCFDYFPWLAYTAFDMCHDDDREKEVISYFRKESKNSICSNFKESVFSFNDVPKEEETTNKCSKSIMNLSASALGEIMKWRNLDVNEYDIFCCLEEWAKCEKLNEDKTENLCKETKICSRKEDAKEIAKNIRVTYIEPWNLVKVRESDFVENEILMGAFETHALALQSMKKPKSYFEMLNQPRLSFPSKITVKGAGVSAVNGTYESGGLYKGVDFYEKEGDWRDKKETFCMYRYCYNKTITWYIVISPNGGDLGKIDEIDFYSKTVSDGNEILTPPKLWKTLGEGSEPAPTASYIVE